MTEARSRTLNMSAIGPGESELVDRAATGFGKRFQKIPLRDLALFFKFMGTLLAAGLPLTRALYFTGTQARSPLLRRTVEAISRDIERGSHLSEALAAFPQFFSEFTVQMIVVGESSGSLPEIIAKISQFMEKRLDTRRGLMSALAYPALLLFACISVVIFMLTSAIPQLASIFEGMGAELPTITRFFLAASAFLLGWGWLVGIVIAAVVLGFVAWRLTPSGKETWDRLKLSIPFFGTLISKMAASQFASTLSVLLSGGVSLLKSLEVTAYAADNRHVRASLLVVRDKVAHGDNLHSALSEISLFNDMVCALVAVGEESAELDKMLLHVQTIYDQEVDIAIKTFTRLIEPIMIVAMTGIVGVIAAAILIPIADLSTAVG